MKKSCTQAKRKAVLHIILASPREAKQPSFVWCNWDHAKRVFEVPLEQCSVAAGESDEVQECVMGKKWSGKSMQVEVQRVNNVR